MADKTIEAVVGWRVFGVADGTHFIIADCTDEREAARIISERGEDYPYKRPLIYGDTDRITRALDEGNAAGGMALDALVAAGFVKSGKAREARELMAKFSHPAPALTAGEREALRLVIFYAEQRAQTPDNYRTDFDVKVRMLLPVLRRLAPGVTG